MADKSIIHQLDSFSISTTEEKITRQLEATHLNKPPSIFQVPNEPQQPQLQPKQEWQPLSLEKETEDEGWGDGPPSYTSISQGTYFGLNSILQPTLYQPSTPSTTSSQAFSKFKHQPVSFVSAAANHSNLHNH
ncbi:hypothetical protein EDC96DRAFT_576793 [Choanephora cucurbitarum]|nr:hypothetical protein EDC96DRAFT_576793 [Choanephora cucurbitarum]